MLRAFSLALLALTTTAGAQWTLQNSGTTASLRGIHSLGDGLAWASGTGGTVLRTEDGGKNWQLCKTPPGAEMLDFRGVQAFDAKTAIVMSSGKGDLSRLYKTADGCQTWKLMFTNPDKDGFWDVVHASRTDQGIELLVVGDPVNGRFATFQSMDAGTVLKKFDAGGLTALDGEGAFAASNSSSDINIDRLTAIFGTGGPHGARVYVLCSSCRSQEGWKAHNLPGFASGQSAGVFSVANHALNWVVVGGDYRNPEDSSGNAAFSRDDGRNWMLSTTFPHGYRSSVTYDAAAKVWIAVGTNGTDISTDDGRNWRALKPGPNDAPDADRNWNALSLPFVVGPKGRIGVLRSEALKRQ